MATPTKIVNSMATIYMGELMDRKPVFITSNTPIWTFVCNEAQPLGNRMYSHMYLETSSTAQQYNKKGTPNFRYFQTVFRTTEMILSFFSIPLNDNITDPTTLEVIQAYANTDLTGSNIEEMFKEEMTEETPKTIP